MDDLPRLDELKRPVPLASLLQCRLVRTLVDEKHIGLDLYEEGPDGLVDGIGDILGTWLMRAIPAKDLLGRHTYTIYLPPSQDDLREGHIHGEKVGRVTSNFMGTTFTIFERTENDRNKIWQEMCAVKYQINFLGRQGPRKMTAVISAVDKYGAVIRPLQNRKSLVDRYLSKKTDSHVIMLENKLPRWDPDTRSFVLEFFNRVFMSSVKNFQLVHPEDVDYTAVQFGKVVNDVFTLDVRYPMTPIMALGIAISSMDHKFACP